MFLPETEVVGRSGWAVSFENAHVPNYGKHSA
jgi:hypothetical protein